MIGRTGEGKVRFASSSGEVTGTGSTIGGLVGYNYSATIEGSFSDAIVNGGLRVGGLAGINLDDSQIIDSHSAGEVTANSYVGGLVGQNGGTIRRSSSSANVTNNTGESTGGLIGWNDQGAVTHSWSTGAVTGTRHVGGLVGQNEGSITNSSSDANVTNSGENTGGLVGLNRDGTVANSYSTGLVTGAAPSAGGLVGYDHGGNGTFTNSYWDEETSEQTTSAGGEGKTTAEMQREATYDGWDFDDVWSIADGFDYPDLRDNPR